MRKILKTKVMTEMELKQDINNHLNEINAVVSELKAKSDTDTLKPKPEKTLSENNNKSIFDNTSKEKILWRYELLKSRMVVSFRSVSTDIRRLRF